jgi:membrane-associated phospholipid phosphatase
MRVLAEVISWVFMPLFMPIYALALVMFVPSNQDYFFNADCLYTISASGKYALLILFFVFSVALPGVSFLILQRTKVIATIEMQERRERTIPIVIMLAYCLALYMLFVVKVGHGFISKFAFSLPLSGVCVTLVFFFLNRWKKVSIHAGAAGIFTGFILAYILQHVEYQLWMLSLAILISGLVMTARMYLEKHTLLEIFVGWLTGTLITFGVNYFY